MSAASPTHPKAKNGLPDPSTSPSKNTGLGSIHWTTGGSGKLPLTAAVTAPVATLYNWISCWTVCPGTLSPNTFGNCAAVEVPDVPGQLTVWIVNVVGV